MFKEAAYQRLPNVSYATKITSCHQDHQDHKAHQSHQRSPKILKVNKVIIVTNVKKYYFVVNFQMIQRPKLKPTVTKTKDHYMLLRSPNVKIEYFEFVI